jgi:hypothetical protein
MRPAIPPLAAFLAGCLQIGTGTGSGTGPGSAADSGTPGTSLPRSAVSDAGPTGSNCFALPGTQAVLCEQVDTCPGLLVDPGAFPDCGFRVRASGGPPGGGALDLECLCGTALCPIGVPTTCSEAKQLLLGQTVLGVCIQQDEGRCVELLPADAGQNSACDRSCADSCAGAPSCIQLCGC